jgi:hypothetical protein
MRSRRRRMAGLITLSSGTAPASACGAAVRDLVTITARRRIIEFQV